MILFWAGNIMVAAAILGLFVGAWIIGKGPHTGADQKPSTGKRVAILLLRIQTFIPLPIFAWINMHSVDPRQNRLPAYYETSIFYLVLTGVVLTVPVIVLWGLYGKGKQRVIGGVMSVLCVLFIIFLAMIGGAAGAAA